MGARAGGERLIVPVLQKGETLTASTEVRADPERVYAVTYLLEPGSAAGTTRLTEMFRMCVPLPFGVVIFEHLFLFVRDRRADLQRNLDASVDRIRAIVEAGVDA